MALLQNWNKHMYLNSLWPTDAIWQYETGSELVQVIACCLTAQSHYLNQSWLPCGRQGFVFGHSAGSIFHVFSWMDMFVFIPISLTYVFQGYNLQWVSTGWDNGLLLPGKKQLPEPMLTRTGGWCSKQNCYLEFQKLMNSHFSIDYIFFNVWVRCLDWNFKECLWNYTQNVLPIHRKMWFLYNVEN